MAVTSPAAGTPTQKESPIFAVRYAEVYAPTPRNAPWPREICPVNPVRMLSPTAPMTAIRICRAIQRYSPLTRNGSARRATPRNPMQTLMKGVWKILTSFS